MTIKTLAAAITLAAFAAGTTDTDFTFTITGKNADGSDFSQSVTSPTPSVQFDLPAGTGFVLVVSKLGHSSLPSAPFDNPVATTVSLSVPDSTQAATIS